MRVSPEVLARLRRMVDACAAAGYDVTQLYVTDLRDLLADLNEALAVADAARAYARGDLRAEDFYAIEAALDVLDAEPETAAS